MKLKRLLLHSDYTTLKRAAGNYDRVTYNITVGTVQVTNMYMY